MTFGFPIVMAYITGGRLNQNRSVWRLSILSDMFWGFLNVVTIFFRTMFEPDLTSKQLRTASYSGSGRTGGDPPPRPPRRMGGIQRKGGPAAPPMSGGG